MTTERVLVVERPGHAAFRTEPPRGPLPDGSFDVQTLYSGLSAGTELSFFKGTHPNLTSDWDSELGLFQAVDRRPGYPVLRWGYMQVGRVTASRAAAPEPGELVAMTYGHRSGYRGNPLRDRVVPVPDDLHPMLGIYVAHMGPICANGLLHAAADQHGADVRSLADGVRGRKVAITGAGVVGLLTALFSRMHGAEEVVLVEPAKARRAVAEALGFTTLDPDAQDPAVLLKTRWRHGPQDRGADVVFQCRGQAASLALALRLLRPQGPVVDLAFYQHGADAVRLGEEFHHNGLAIRCAQISRVPRGMAHSWDRERLSAETVAMLRIHGEAVMEHVITDVVPVEHAPELLAAVAQRRHHVLQAVFTFTSAGQ
ncbi:zinc-binding alcohol dehydrogenase [Kibdelosporangium persicum]|uniref:Zinc-type alcohol dehydrogenase YcjQ n=1 Tax=Kibdelosporangium persicum TaxID=2698649 RepID=A0ABX2FKR9_9PSEU|nr:zinc-binding alcohol dehydrogenase [Kibdelosporangium persicum]NRN71386.1 Zinc-type alcohol dehydrogenase YcjQ [Kibdelosporangium persicum]